MPVGSHRKKEKSTKTARLTKIGQLQANPTVVTLIKQKNPMMLEIKKGNRLEDFQQTCCMMDQMRPQPEWVNAAVISTVQRQARRTKAQTTNTQP